MLRKFYKLHGIGNDYIYFDCMKEPLENVEELAIRLSNRHFSIGGDGIILLCPSDIADCKMRMFNADGSEGRMCGNGVRCVGKLAHDLGYVKGDICRVETLSGIKVLDLKCGDDGTVVSAKVDMGKPILNGRQIPSLLGGDKIVDRPVKIGGEDWRITLVSMGNPHCIVFKDPYEIDLEKIGSQFEHCELFPERINTEFVGVDKKGELTMRVWERGSCETLACGTGACAVAVAAYLNGFAELNSPVTVHLKGGDLTIIYTGETVYMEGGAALAFTGLVEI